MGLGPPRVLTGLPDLQPKEPHTGGICALLGVSPGAGVWLCRARKETFDTQPPTSIAPKQKQEARYLWTWLWALTEGVPHMGPPLA